MSDEIKKNAEDIIGAEAGGAGPGATAPLSDVEATAVMEAVESPDITGVDVLADGSPVGEPHEAAAPVDAGEAAVEGAPGKKKGAIAAVVAVAVVAVVGIGAAFALQPASSGDPSGSAASPATASSSAPSSGSSSSAVASKSSASGSSSSAAASSDSSSSASSGGAAKSEGASGSSGAASSSGNAATGNGGTAVSSGSTGSSGNTASSGGNNATTGNASNAGGGTASTPSHTHNWVPVTDTHPVIDQEEWDEPVYGTETHNFCSICGDIWFENLGDHGDRVHPDEYFSGGSRPVQVQTGSIHHEAVTHDETVTVGYRCTECGATK